MPSTTHEVLAELFRHRPELVPDLLAGALDVAMPEYKNARVESIDFTQVTPTEYRADATVVLDADSAVLAVVVEIQLRRDAEKRWTWPVYLTTLRARLRCPTMLLVLCPDEETASWCGEGIELGQPGLMFTPLVIGPHRVPYLTDRATARAEPELAMLSALAHGGDPDRQDIIPLFLEALQTVEPDRAELYCDVVAAALPLAARRFMEDLLNTKTYEWQSDYARRLVAEGVAEGLAEGEAKSVFAVLDARGIDVPADVHTRIAECTDLDQLERWIRRAAVADTIDDIFA